LWSGSEAIESRSFCSGPCVQQFVPETILRVDENFVIPCRRGLPPRRLPVLLASVNQASPSNEPVQASPKRSSGLFEDPAPGIVLHNVNSATCNPAKHGPPCN